MKRTTSSLLKAHSRDSLSRLLFESECSNGSGGDDRSITFRFAQVLVLAIRAVTPLSYCYMLYLLFHPKVIYNVTDISRPSVVALITLWMLLQPNPHLNHFGSSPEERRKLVHNCFNALKMASGSHESHFYIRKAIEGYFLDVSCQEIYRDNFKDWVAWAYFGRDTKDLSREEIIENDEYVAHIEFMAQWKFREGRKRDLMAARLTLDPLFATQRPFVFYAVISLVNIATHGVLYTMFGYRKLSRFESKAMAVYHRPASRQVSSRSSESRLPIVFVHGIGIGFAHYIALIANLPADVDVFLVEWPHVAMQMSSVAPTSSETVNILLGVLEEFGHEEACFVAHSLGTTAVSWMLHHPIGKTKVASTVLLDPVVFLLCDPTVCTAFVYKDPVTTLDFMMHFFLSRELFIANALSRHFSWSENIMFVEDLTDCTRSKSLRYPNTVFHSVVISQSDKIIPVEHIKVYFKAKASEGHRSFEFNVVDGTHGEMFLVPSRLALIIEKIRLRISKSDS